MFDALTGLSTHIPDAYHRASEFDDLRMGDLHLVQLDGWFLHYLHYFYLKTSTSYLISLLLLLFCSKYCSL